ncbi:MAG: hypothetical protein WDN24_20060 [Sphingomonas sp.]
MSHDCSCHGPDDRLATTVIGQIERPLYAPGLILQDSDLTAAVDYTRELNRLLFRTLFGCGVICGLRVGIREDCGLTVTIAPASRSTAAATRSTCPARPRSNSTSATGC